MKSPGKRELLTDRTVESDFRASRRALSAGCQSFLLLNALPKRARESIKNDLSN